MSCPECRSWTMKKCLSTEFIRELDIYLVKLQRILLENLLFILTLDPTQVQDPVEKINNLKMDELETSCEDGRDLVVLSPRQSAHRPVRPEHAATRPEHPQAVEHVGPELFLLFKC